MLVAILAAILLMAASIGFVLDFTMLVILACIS